MAALVVMALDTRTDLWGKVLAVAFRVLFWALSTIYLWKMGTSILHNYRADHSPFRPFCPHCGKYISAHIDWKCGCCGEKNSDTKTFSFLYKCQHCEAIPKSYCCHHCGKIVALVENGDDKLSATKWTPVDSEDAIRSKWQRDKEQHHQALELSQLATALAKQKTEQRLAEAAVDTKWLKPKSPREQQEEEFARVRDTHLARFEIIARAKKEAAAEPDASYSKRQLDVIAWMEKEWGIE